MERDGGKHSFGSSLELRDNVGLPDQSQQTEEQPIGQDAIRVPFTWISETDERAVSFRTVRRSELLEGQS